MKFHKTYVCEEDQHALSQALDISSNTQIAPNLFKVLVILSDTTVRRSAVEPKDLKPY